MSSSSSPALLIHQGTCHALFAYDVGWAIDLVEAERRIAAGTELLATAHFDNSELNPNNPDPSATVYWGEGTTDEMFSTRFKYRVIGHPNEIAAQRE